MNILQTRQVIQTHGLWAGIHDLCYRAANRVADAEVFQGMQLTLKTLDPSYLEGSAAGWGFVERDALIAQIRRHPQVNMEEPGVLADLSRGNRCYGMIVDGLLVSYGWYSSVPTAATDDLLLHFDPAYAYMYHGYTIPSFRGKRLHGIGMARALAALTAEGKKGLVSYVRSNNFASLKSCYRMGYVRFGHLFAAKVNGEHVTYATPGCRAYDFRLSSLTGSHDADRCASEI